MKRYIPLFPMLLVAVIGTAQTVGDTINRMVLVESTYNPIIVGAVKRNFIPEEVKPSMSKEKVVYADENVPLTTFDRMAQPAETVSITPEEESAPGYAHLGCGNYNNLSGLAAYKWRFGTSDDLTLKAHIDGWNGTLKPLNSTVQWRSHLCDMGINAEYSTQLRGVAVETGIHAAYSSYNYLTDGTHNKGADLQQTGNLGAYIGIEGSIKSDFHYRARAGYAHLGRCTLLGTRTPHSEGHFSIDGSVGMNLHEWGMASLQLQGDVLTYRGIGYYHGYHSLSLTPRWDYRLGDLRFAAGFNMDFLGGNRTLHTPLQLSPECYVNYVPADKPFTARFTLDGGRDVNTFGRLYALSPYWASATQVLPTYTFMNARLEGGVRIVEGLHLHLGGAYKILSDALFETVGYLSGVTYTCITNHNARVATLDVAIDYVYKDVANLSVKGTNHYWILKGDRSLLARAPQFKVDADARVRIMPKLYAYTDLLIVSFTKVVARERAIIDWGLGADYAFSKRLSLFLDVHNLLGSRYSYYTGYPAQGFNVLVGAKFKF